MASEYKIAIVMVAEDKASKILKQLAKETGGAVQNLDELDDKAGKTKEKSKDLADVLSGTLKAGLTIGVAMSAAKAAIELAELGATSLRTGRAFENISGGAGEANLRLEAMKRATRGAMSEMQMMGSANQLMQMGLANNADELENITKMAVKLGTAMGRDAGGSISDFSLMLANQSIPRLDTFGISAGKVRTRILELQASTEGMTREAAFMQAVMEEGGKAMSRLGDDVEDEALAFEKLQASWMDLKAVAGEALAPALSEIVGGLADVTREVVEQRTQMEEYTRTLGKDTVKAIMSTARVTADMTDEERMLAEASYILGDSMVNQAEGLERLEKEYQTMMRVNKLSAGQMADYAAMAGKAEEATIEVAEAMSTELDIALSKTQIQLLKTSQGWDDSLAGYTDYLTEREQLTVDAEDEIAAVEAEYSGRRFATEQSTAEEIAAFQIEAAAKEVQAFRGIEGKKTEEEKAYAQQRYNDLVAGNQQELAQMQGHEVMVSGITRTEADKRIAAIQDEMAEGLAAKEEGWTKELEEQRQHFAEMQVAFLENKLAGEGMTEAQRAVTEEALTQMQLEFGLTTEDAIAMTEAEVALRDALSGMAEEDVPGWVDAMGEFQTATVDGEITADELRGVIENLDDETADRLMKIFPEAGSVLLDVGADMDVLRDAAQSAYDVMSLLDDKMMALGGGGGGAGGAVSRRQHGGPASGLTMVGEGGPEALYMPPGSYVHSNQSPTTQRVMNDNRSYNRTVNVGTALALALEANRAQQEQTARANSLM